MRMRTAVAGVLVALGIGMAAPAHPALAPGTVSIGGRLGWTTLSLGDINDAIGSARSDFQADTAVSDILWDDLGGAPNLGIEVEVQLTPKISTGLAFSYQRGSRRHEAVRSFVDTVTFDFADETFEENPRFYAWDVVGTLGLWVPSAPGLHFGLQLGLVRGTFENRSIVFSETNALSVIEFRQGSWDGTGLVLSAFTGYEQSLSRVLALSSRLGYRYRNIRRPDGLSGLTGFDDNGHYREFDSGPLTDSDGEPMELDLGGFYFNLGLNVRIGGSE